MVSLIVVSLILNKINRIWEILLIFKWLFIKRCTFKNMNIISLFELVHKMVSVPGKF